jgi:hypothetical protein
LIASADAGGARHGSRRRCTWTSIALTRPAP